jgi:hypothetical protein
MMWRTLLLAALLAALMLLCSCTTKPQQPHIHLMYPAGSHKAIELAASDLQAELAMLPGAIITKGSLANAEADLTILIGVAEQLKGHQLLNTESQALLAEIKQPRSGLMHQQQGDTALIVLAGADVQGTQYSVYDFSQQYLNTDPLRYWTGSEPEVVSMQQMLQLKTQRIDAPVVPLLVYFENDVDELANFRGTKLQYDWESFTALIDSLVRMRYNAIELFDMLGRVEFYQRPEYQSRYPDYQLDRAYLNKMIDYIHDKGMLLQVDMMMGRQLGSLPETESNCWSEHQQSWKDLWLYYLKETPIGRADIFSLRPRHQVWDWPYQSACNEDKTQVFNQVYAALGQLLDQHKPGVIKVCTCYHDGMELFNAGFNPPKDFIVAWSDNGWGEFDYLPQSDKGHAMGTYVHAGFWLNHDVADPYPKRIEQVMDFMYQQHKADRYMMVNGQTFRPFLLNLAAYAESARLGRAFNSETFTRAWFERYFGAAAMPAALTAMQQLNQAHSDEVGYVEILWQVKVLQGFLADTPVQQPGKDEFTVTAERILPWFSATAPRIKALDIGLLQAHAGLNAAKNQVFYHDFVVLPLQLYQDLLHYNQLLLQMAQMKLYSPSDWRGEKGAALLHQAKTQLQLLHQRRLTGDQNPRWANWYHPDNRRPNNGFPVMADLEAIAKAR